MSALFSFGMLFGWFTAIIIGILYLSDRDNWRREKERYDYTIKELIRIYVGVDLEEESKEIIKAAEGGGKSGSGSGVGRVKRGKVGYILSDDSLNVSLKEKVEEAVKGWEIPLE